MKKPEIDFLLEYSQSELIEELKRIQAIVGDRPITKRDIERYGRASRSVYYAKFGSFTKALLAAGLTPSRRVGATDEELLTALMEGWLKILEEEGRRPYRTDLKKYGVPYSPDVYVKRFGNWRKALRAAYESVDSNRVDEQEREITQAQRTRMGDVAKREEISIRRRFLVFKRDQFTCVLCGRSGIGVRLELDHIIPLARGGGNETDNLQTLCYECNRGKRDDLEK